MTSVETIRVDSDGTVSYTLDDVKQDCSFGIEELPGEKCLQP